MASNDNQQAGEGQKLYNSGDASRFSENRNHAPGGTGANAGLTRDVLLARFIRLSSAALSSATPRESAAIIVNRISELVPVDRAVLVNLSGSSAIVAVTGGGNVAQDSEFAEAVEAVRDRFRDQRYPVRVPPVSGTLDGPGRYLHNIQNAMGGTEILWLPLWLDKDGKRLPEHALWLERWQGNKWENADIELLQHMALYFGHSLSKSKAPLTKGKRRFRNWILAAMILLFLFLPVTSSVVAPVRVVPDRPYYVFAPMDGILKELYVQPGQWVKENTLLFTYDSRVLDKRLEEAYRNVAVAKARLARLEGAAHRDPQARAELPIQKLEVERAEADVQFFLNQRSRAEVRTPKSGVIVLDDPDALIGATLQTGQAVLSVADPARTKLRISVSVSDIGNVKKGDRVSVRLDKNPLKSLPAVVTRVGFEVKLSENNVPSVITEAIWVQDTANITPGQAGSARIMGDTTLLGIQLFRKPLAALRSVIGI